MKDSWRASSVMVLWRCILAALLIFKRLKWRGASGSDAPPARPPARLSNANPGDFGHGSVAKRTPANAHAERPQLYGAPRAAQQNCCPATLRTWLRARDVENHRSEEHTSELQSLRHLV